MAECAREGDGEDDAREVATPGEANEGDVRALQCGKGRDRRG